MRRRGHRRRGRNQRRRGTSPTSPSLNEEHDLDTMEMEFVEACGRTERDRILASISLCCKFNISKEGFDKIRDFGVAENLALVVSAPHPYIVYAKYVVERSLTKVMLHKTEMRLPELLQGAPEMLKAVQMADNTALYYCVMACKFLLDWVQPENDSYNMYDLAIRASLRVLLDGGARFVKVAERLPYNVPAEKFLSFTLNPATEAIHAVAQLMVTLEDNVVQILHDLYREGFGRVLIHLLNEDSGPLIRGYRDALAYLVAYTLEEADALAAKNIAKEDEVELSASLAFAQKEAKKGKRELKKRLKEVEEAHADAVGVLKQKTQLWKHALRMLENTKRALQHVSMQLGSIVDCIGIFCYHVQDAKAQVMKEGIIDTLAEVIRVENIEENSQGVATHLGLRVSAARALGRLCSGGFTEGQKRVNSPLGCHLSLYKLFQFDCHAYLEDTDNTSFKSIDVKRWSATALRQCCGECTTSINEILKSGAVKTLMAHVESCLRGTRDEQESESSSAAAQCIGHLTASCAGLHILGGESALLILLAVMANGTDSSSHAARIIGNAFSGAPASSFRALANSGGLESITKFLEFISEKTLNRVNTKNQLIVLAEVLRAAEKCVTAENQDMVIKYGILGPLERLSTWILETQDVGGSSSASGHGDVQAGALRCLVATVSGNSAGKKSVSTVATLRSLMHAMQASDYSPAKISFCNLFATLADEAQSTQNTYLNIGLFTLIGSFFTDPEQSHNLPPSVHAAAAQMLNRSIKKNAHMLLEVKSQGILAAGIRRGKSVLESSGNPELCASLCQLLEAAARSSDNREHVRELGGISFCCNCLASISLDETSVKPSIRDRGHQDIVAQNKLIEAATNAITALCFCDVRTINAVAEDENAAIAITQMLRVSQRKEVIYLCATIVPILCAPRGDYEHYIACGEKRKFLDIGGLKYLCRQLANSLNDCRCKDTLRKREKPEPKALSIKHFQKTVKLITAIGSCAIRFTEAQNLARREGTLDHIVCVLQMLKSNRVPRSDPRWDALLCAVCDTLHWLCARNPESQQKLLNLGGSKLLSHLLGDDNLRNQRLRGAGSDASRSIAYGWGEADDAMNILLL